MKDQKLVAYHGEDGFFQAYHIEKIYKCEKNVVCRLLYKPIKTKITGVANEKICTRLIFSL